MTRRFGSKWPLAASVLIAVGCGGSKSPASSTGTGRQPATAADSDPLEQSEAPSPAQPKAADRGDLGPSCEEALASIERIHGAELADGSAVVFEHIRSLTRAELRQWCKKWSPWTRKCAILAQTRAQLSSCEPDLQPLPRSHFGDAAKSAREEFYSCVGAATTWGALALCTEAYLGE